MGAFIDIMINAVEEQMRKAWYAGMRSNGLRVPQDMTPEFEGELQRIINSEFDHILDFAQAVEDARVNARPVDSLVARSKLWANRYNDTENYARIYTKPQDRYEWVLGPTEEHCTTCASLSGVVATGEQWRLSGYRPQNPPNGKLECGGWRCRCELQRTDKDIQGLALIGM